MSIYRAVKPWKYKIALYIVFFFLFGLENAAMK